MKFRELIIRNFGQISDRRIEITDGINLFYGENESGKTTIHTFIKSMLFGLERGRGRAALGDVFSQYQPWESPNYYAGLLRFESGGKTFLLERNFDKYAKSTRLICEDDGEEFSLEHGDLDVLLGGLTMANYENTVSIGQMKAEPEQSLAAELQNYATNYYATGESDIDLDKTLTYLAQRKKENEKAIRATLQKKQEERNEIEREADYIWRDMQKIEQKLAGLNHKIEKVEKDGEEKKYRIHWVEIIGVIAAILLLVFLGPKPWGYVTAGALVVVESFFVWGRLRSSKKTAPEDENKALWEKELLQEEFKEKKVQYENLKEQLEEQDVTKCEPEQEMKKQALELATEKILELSKDVHHELSGVLNKKASEILSEITGGKYSRLFVDEKLKMSIYTGERKVAIEQLSRGTIEQIYFALRMAASEILYEEEYPIVLDDTFVYYDDERLENTLRWIKNSGKQVLLFTCHKREGEILKKI